MKKKTSFLSLLDKIFRLSFSNVWRNRFLSLATIFVMGTIIFIFNIILAVNHISNEAISDLSEKIDIVLYLKESTDYQQTQDLITEISSFEGVTEINLISKEDALNKIRTTHPDITEAFDKFNLDNPLPASINIRTTDPKYHKSIAETLNNDKYRIYFTNIVSSETSENSGVISSVSQNLFKLSNFAKQVIFWLIMIFIIGGTLIILNALQITIYHRKEEINVMRLVGASNFFIKMPFIIESIIYGILSVLFSFLLLLALSQKIEIESTSLWSYYSNIKYLHIFIMELLATIIISIASSMLAVQEYLQKQKID